MDRKTRKIKTLNRCFAHKKKCGKIVYEAERRKERTDQCG